MIGFHPTSRSISVFSRSGWVWRFWSPKDLPSAQNLPVKLLGQGIVKILGPHRPEQAHGEGALRGTTDSPPAHEGKSPRSVSFDDTGKFLGYLLDGLVPGYSFKGIPDFFKRMEETVGMMLVEVDIQSLPADITLTPGIVFISANFDDLILFDSNLESALIAS